MAFQKDGKSMMTTLQRRQEDQRNRILQYAMGEFTTRGVRSVKMDEVAAELSMSKRTLYEFFGDKENLLVESMRYYNQKMHEEARTITANAANPLEAYVLMSNHKLNELHGINPTFLTEAHRYESVRKLIEEEMNYRNQHALKFVNACVEAGLFRPDVNYPLVIRVFDLTGQAILSNELHQEFGLEEIMRTIDFTLIRGLCTPKGIAVLDDASQRFGKRHW